MLYSAKIADTVCMEETMNPTFVYSLDRETFVGSYTSRNEALAAALKRADGNPTPVTAVFVGQRVSPNPRAFGHARSVIDRMKARVTEDIGDAASSYLRGLSDGQVTELDSSIEKVVLDWLEKHSLFPKSEQVEAVTEHPVPVPMQWRPPVSESSENNVTSVGETRSW
jgi:hypothetical protein